jgi:hypothetical protein
MSLYGGLVFHFSEPKHRATVWRRVERGQHFTEYVSNLDVMPALAEICLLSFDGETISHICLARSGKLQVTGRMTLKFSSFTDLNSVRRSELEQMPEMRSISQLFSGSVRRINGSDWRALLDALKKLRPTQMQAADDLEERRQLAGKRTEQPAVETIAQERDATRLALEFFGMEKDEIRKSLEIKLPLEPAPFLIGIKGAKLREDSMIDHDARALPDFPKMLPYVQGSVEFTKDKERITILNVNRAGVERAIGVDLIYYTHTFESYVMVQYKRLHKAASDWEFNLNDKQFIADLARMEAFNGKNPTPAFSGDPVNYRLNLQHFYFKFCKDVTYEPLNSSMIEGIYLPQDYLECLMKSSLVDGANGGRVLRLEEVLRHFNNTHFIELVRGGWIGSRTKTTETVTELVQSSIEADRSAIVGLATRIQG